MSMSLQDKYRELTNAATISGVANLLVREQDGVLYIDGEAPNGSVKDMLWTVYDKIDPNFLTGDLVMNVNVIATAPVTHAQVTTERSNLNIRKGPGTDQPIQSSEQWWLVRTKDGEEGYSYAQYLTPVDAPAEPAAPEQN
jgi:hypothetical protein